jgi:hypothetical protein
MSNPDGGRVTRRAPTDVSFALANFRLMLWFPIYERSRQFYSKMGETGGRGDGGSVIFILSDLQISDLDR